MSQVLEYFQQSQDARWYSNFGPCVQELERRLQHEQCGGRPVVTAGNATVALMVALRATFGTPEGERRMVALPSFTFVASIAAVEWAGFEPLFFDVDADDWQASPSSLRDVLSRNKAHVVGVMLTTTFGTTPSARKAAELDAAIKEFMLPVVVDAAAALGSDPGPSHVDCAAEVYSLHATKPFAVGEGAAIACRDEAVAASVRALTNFGFDAAREIHGPLGINAKMPELMAAVGLAVLDRFPDIVATRRRFATSLIERLEPLALTPQAGHGRSVFQFLPLLASSSVHRKRLASAADEAQVQLRFYFDPPMHEVQPKAARSESLENTERLARQMVCLPMANDLSEAAMTRIVEVAEESAG